MRKAIDTLILTVVLAATWSMHMCEANGTVMGNLRRKRDDKAAKVQVERPLIHDSEFMLAPKEHTEKIAAANVGHPEVRATEFMLEPKRHLEKGPNAAVDRPEVRATEFMLEPKQPLEKAPGVKAAHPAVPDSEFMLKSEEHLEDLWNRAMTVDKRDTDNDRFLQLSMSFSMATRPPNQGRPTTPRPTPSGTTAPAPSAAPSSSNPPSSSFAPSPQTTLITPTINPTLNPTGAPSSSSAAPSANCLSGTTREAFLLSVLTPITDASLLLDPLSPQGQGFNWIVNQDPLNFDPCVYPSIAQRYGLATFFFATSGSLWIANTEWLGPMNECAWFGITCDTTTNTTVEKLQLRKFLSAAFTVFFLTVCTHILYQQH